MLTETEILDTQVQTLDEAMDKLAAHDENPVTENVVSDQGVAQAVQITMECLRATVDLYHTISQEGVSADDVRALRHIRERMAPFMTLQHAVALENYEGMFTPGRSMINQVVSQEATLAEVGITLKEWFFKFIDFIIRLVDWCRGAWNSETAINMRLRAIDHNLQSMFNAFDLVYKRAASVSRDFNGELEAIWSQALKDPKLTRSPAMLYAFGQTENAGVYKDASNEASDAYRWIIMDIAGLKQRLEKDEPMNLGHDYAEQVNDAAYQLEALNVADAKVDYLEKHLGKDYWRRPKTLLARKPVLPSEQIAQVQDIAKRLRDIRRNANFADLKDTDALTRAVDNITGTMQGLERIITIKQTLFTDFYKASATMANFYIRGHDLMLQEILKHDNADSAKIFSDKVSKSWEDICVKMGI
jgi:hypothetical protein